MRVSAPLFCFSVAALAMTASIAAVPASLAARRVSGSPPRFAGELDGQDSALEKRMEKSLSEKLSDWLAHSPPVKEMEALALMVKIHSLQEQIEHLSISASTSQQPSTSTSQHPSTSTSKDSELKSLTNARDLHEEKLIRTLAADHTIALKDCLAEDETKVEWSDSCFMALQKVYHHLEAPLRKTAERARKGDLSGPEEQRMMTVVEQYAQKLRQLKNDVRRLIPGIDSDPDKDLD
ncbi:hypothetical protein FA10DRAFT_258537 [Acaromyces ingoldii]|uniref:Uncharacterized protein n=1 Tax=Acaromyces ingoldii TaxID=215250 RepID=A0A316YPK7_9BASI|nr:hypothetical protein FA10DRAFT_258537 [Acaromyces ingoldii]PWN91082.1 hypothetical protein FA10DRAFT_258537 [Acaromyces ingoldii]